MMCHDRIQQEEELAALESIFSSEYFQVLLGVKQHKATFLASVVLPPAYYVKYKENGAYASFPVQHLPPVQLKISLPQTYPTKKRPQCRLICDWLDKDKIHRVKDKLHDLWLENIYSEVLFTWCDFLQNDILDYLGYGRELDISDVHEHYMRATEEQSVPYRNKTVLSTTCTGPRPVKRERRKKGVSHEPARQTVSLAQHLISYNNFCLDKMFLKQCFTCVVCCTDKLGKYCSVFGTCQHVFCKECIREYFTVRIKEGSVNSIKCPYDKCMVEAHPTQVKDAVGAELFTRYDSLLLSTALDSLGDIVYCPLSNCQYPITIPDNPDEKMVICPSCAIGFCLVCKSASHGIEPCKFKAEERQKLVELYQNACPEEKERMEMRYGKRNLQFLVNTFMTESWMKDNSKPCPHCNAAIEKSSGCNKMTCFKCNTFFCWLCMDVLDDIDPYLHYTNPNSGCANKLFYLTPEADPGEGILREEEDEDWDGWDWVDVDDDSDLSDLELNEPDTD